LPGSNIQLKRSQLPTARTLLPGDSIEVSVSYELKIDRESAWVSYKVYTRVQDDELPDDASARALSHLTVSIDKAIDAAVEYAQKKSNK
jgi:hypothetical protein